MRSARLSRLSVRRGVGLTLLLMVVLALVQLVTNNGAITSAAFLLNRAEASQQQLGAYRQLSISVLEYILAHEGVGTTGDANAGRERVERALADLDSLEADEAGLLRDHGGDDTSAAERERVVRIRSTIDAMLATGGASASAASYQTVLKPLMAAAIDGERDEIATVERTMHDMRDRIVWIGRIGTFGQILVVGLILLAVTRAVLDPISRLVTDIGELGRGRLGHRVQVGRHNEFGLLAQHINRMARHLERGRRSLVEANDRLEATVAERTRALEATNRELREIDESRRRFLGDVSHELRTPLTAIVGEADVTLRFGKGDGPTCEEALASILANANLLNRRIDDLMALARSSDGRMSLQSEAVDLNVLATEAMADIRSLAKLNRVTARFTPLTVPVLVEGDRTRLRQCLMILLDNAVKFSRAGQTVDIVLTERGSHADLAVVDHGRGIEVEELPRVFERFYQTEVGRRMGGTGLGLAIARRIVEAHHGAIAAKSDAGGTSIAITFPVLQEAEA